MNETKPTIDELVFTYARRLRISLLDAWGIDPLTTERYSPQEVISAGDAIRARFAKLETERDDLLASCELQEHADRLRTVWLCNQAVPGYDSSEDRRAWHEALGLAEEARRAAIDKARGNDVPTDA